MSEASPLVAPIPELPHSSQTNNAAIPGVTPIPHMPRDIEQGGDRIRHDTQVVVVSTIRHHYRRRVDYHSAEKRLTLQIKAICRRLSDGSLTDDST